MDIVVGIHEENGLDAILLHVVCRVLLDERILAQRLHPVDFLDRLPVNPDSREVVYIIRSVNSELSTDEFTFMSLDIHVYIHSME